jgi:acetylornithine deacetylase
MIDLLRELIRTPSLARDEGRTADILERVLRDASCPVTRLGNNVVSWEPDRGSGPVILLNSHHDTVRAGQGWTYDPHGATLENGRIIGLGSNDAGGALVMMLATYLHYRERADLPVRFMFAATAEEEVSGQNGMALLTREWFPHHPIDLAIVGEPTGMQLAIAEKGLVVLDCTAHGRTGHAARNEGENAIYAAMDDIAWFRTHSFERESTMLGHVKMTVTQIDAGSQHNVVPDRCHFVVDVRVTDAYTNEDVVDEIRRHVRCTVEPRSLRLAPSRIDPDHPLVQAGVAIGRSTYGSPTMSDQSLLPTGVPSLKIGPGDSARSHTPDEWIGVDEVEEGIVIMRTMLDEMMRRMS